jgi:uncharacterized protein (TIGR03382 family)
LTAVTLLQAAGAVPASIAMALAAIVLAGQARRRTERTIGRIGGERQTRLGRILGIVALCLGTTAALALGFYGLLSLLSG